MIRYLYAVTLGLVSISIPLRAANQPHAGTDIKNAVVWTNDDLERLHSLGLISIVGALDCIYRVAPVCVRVRRAALPPLPHTTLGPGF